MNMHCPLCSQASAGSWFDKLGRTYFRCRSCGHIFVDLNETAIKSAGKQYESGAIFVSDGNENYYFDESNMMSMSLKLDWVKTLHAGEADLLDVGANFGHFLKIAQEYFHAEGIDISPYAVEWSKQHFGVKNMAVSIEDLQSCCSTPYDVITMWDVIEHLPSWEIALTNIAKILRNDGLFFLTTPDASSIVARSLGRHWYYLDPNQHFHLFAKNNLRSILGRYGFEIVDTRRFGRFYKLAYVLDRLSYLSSSVLFHKIAEIVERNAPSVMNRTVYISLGDVIGVCARKRRDI